MSVPNTPMKLTPLYPIAQRLGAEFTEQRRWCIPEVYTTQEAEIAAARSGVVLADESPNGKLTVEGAQAGAILNAAFDPDLPSLAINAGAVVAPDRIYCLRGDLFFVSTSPSSENAVRKKLTTAIEASGDFVTVTDMTHGRAEIRVIGPASQELLSKVCGLDFHPAEFPDGTAKQSSVVKTTQLIIRRDIGELPAFSIIGAQSLGAYVWNTIMEAGGEWGLAPIGRAAIEALAENWPVG